MTQEIETLIEKIESKSPDLEKQAKLVIDEAKKLRKKVADWASGGSFGEKITRSLEEDILNYNSFRDELKKETIRKCNSLLHPILGKNKDIINDLYEAFAITFTNYLNASTDKKLDEFFFIGKDMVKEDIIFTNTTNYVAKAIMKRERWGSERGFPLLKTMLYATYPSPKSFPP